VKSGDEWQQPNDGFPSTHILKPQLIHGDSTIFDEEYGSRIAGHLGLLHYNTWVEEFDGVPTLVIERYDRSSLSPDGRIHQEDMNQVHGASRNEKYQKLGGRMTLKRIAGTLLNRGQADSAGRLAKLNTLAVAVGNLDMHGKNIAMLRPYGASETLAPAYDVVPMTHRDNDHEMALAVNNRYLHADITLGDLIVETESWGLRDAEEIVRETVSSIHDFVDDAAPLKGAYGPLRKDIRRFTTNLLDGRAVGAA
jgi:serine/threonine-protein kinase HipA